MHTNPVIGTEIMFYLTDSREEFVLINLSVLVHEEYNVETE